MKPRNVYIPIALAGLTPAACLTAACAPVRGTATVDIDRPVDSAWAVFADSDRLSEWMHADWDRSTVPWADIDGEKVGEPLLVTLGEEGNEMEITQTITSIRENQEFAYGFDHDWADVDFTFRFEPRGDDACTIAWDYVVRPHGLHHIWINLARSSMQHRFDGHLADLKTLIEEEPPL